MTRPSPVVGETYRLADAEYRYGLGPLLVKVTKVLKVVKYDDEPWWEVEGVAKNPEYAGPGQPRVLYVKAASLKNARRTS
ncbi:MAG: hypothetical protein QOC94_4664 [Actinoplanes sp.]|nr:hypothetical protein [Actinoplanes sp.]